MLVLILLLPTVASLFATTRGGRPVDATLGVVSASAPSSNAAEAMRLCGVDDSRLNSVAGMAQIPANPAKQYVPLVGVEPELQVTDAAWVIAFTGDMPIGRMGDIAKNPVCVVIGDEPIFFMPEGFRDIAGNWHAPVPPQTPPRLALPPLAP